jgi:hypothetical protein
MTRQIKFILGLTTILFGLFLSFNLWFDGENINGNNGFTGILLLILLLLGTSLIILSLSSKTFSFYNLSFAIPIIFYFFFPQIMTNYRHNKLRDNIIKTTAIIKKTGKHKYYKKPSELYYEFEFMFNGKIIRKFNENVFHLSEWKLKTGDTLNIVYASDNENLVDVIGVK